MHEFDAIVIGTGQAGPALAHRLGATGARVAIIERGKFGGTCVNTGCTPTKTLVASAYAAHLARRAGEFGVSVPGEVTVDLPKVMARMRHVSGLSNTGVEKGLRGNPNISVYQGHARFAAAHSISVDGASLSARRIFINVGGRALVPAIPGLEEAGYLTNSSLLAMDTLPSHLVVLGGSYIGLEFAQIYRRFGSRVTVLETAPRIVPREDPDVSAALADVLATEGIAIHTSVHVTGVRRRGEEVLVAFKTDGESQEIVGSHVLVAVGRRPNTDDLGLDKAGIATDDRGFVRVDDELQTNVPGVWALGDCNGRGAFTHTAWNDYEIVAANLLDGDTRRVSDRITAYNLYTDPPLGRVGMTEQEVRRTGRPALLATFPMASVSRAFEKGETKGFIKILADAETKQILGASILGVGGDEVIHSFLPPMYARLPYTVMERAMAIHPTVSELLPTVLGKLKPLN